MIFTNIWILFLNPRRDIINTASKPIFESGDTNHLRLYFKKGKPLFFKKSELVEWLSEGRKKQMAKLKTTLLSIYIKGKINPESLVFYLL